MDINEQLVKDVAKSAKLELTDAEVKKFVPQLQEIFKVFEELAQVDTNGIEPSFQPVSIRNKLRSDEPHQSLSVEDALKNSKHSKDPYFKGPSAV